MGKGVRLTFYGGVGEIGGNKVLLEDRDARLFLDMGQPFTYGEDYFVDTFLQPRDRFGLRDHFALDLMPRIPGLYSQDALDGTDMAWRAAEFSGIAISHIHFDHINHLQFVDPKVPVFMGQGTAIMLESWETTSKMKVGKHAFSFFRTGKGVSVDGVEIEPIHVDHSAPAAYGFLVHTSRGAIAYTGDFRRHGPHADMTDDFVAAAKEARPIAMISEGTRVAPEETRRSGGEEDVRRGAPPVIRKAKGKIVLVTFYPRDVDRIKTFHAVAEETDRRFVLSAKTAHLLRNMKKDTRIDVPDVERDPNVLVYFRDLDKPALWEKDLRATMGSRAVDSAYVNRHQEELMMQLDFYHLQELIDLEPVRGSPFIHSKSEPFDEEDIEAAVRDNWLKRFGLEHVQLHASGHCSLPEMREIVRTVNPKVVLPVHTQHPEMFEDFGPKVVQPTARGTVEV